MSRIFSGPVEMAGTSEEEKKNLQIMTSLYLSLSQEDKQDS